jgi:peptide/nickel transport system substrate-binding protein
MQNGNRRYFCFAWLLMAFMLLFLAVVPADVATLTIGVGRDFYNGPEGQLYVHGSTNTWEGLTYLDEHFIAKPWLAESWKSMDSGKTWVFILRRGVRFHDGTLMTAKRAAECLNRLRRHPRYDPNHLFKLLESLTAEGPDRLVFRLKRAIPYFPKAVSYYGSPIVAPETIAKNGRMSGLIGTGPYKLGKVKPADSLEVLAFDGYWGGRPAFDRVVFRTILDADSRLMALTAGQIDAIVDFGGILPEQLPKLLQTPGLTLKKRELGNTHQLMFNCRKAPFSRQEARLWLAGKIDRDQLVEAFAKGAGVVAHDPHTRLDPEWAFGIIRIKAAPLPKPMISANRELVILIHNGFAGRLPYLEIAQVIQQILTQAGLRARIRIAEPGAYRQARLAGDYDLIIGPTGFLAGDPDYHYANFVSIQSQFSPGWKNDEAERLIEKGGQEANPRLRRKIYRRLSELMNQHLPMLPLYHDVAVYAYKDQVTNLDMDVIFRPWLHAAHPLRSK